MNEWNVGDPVEFEVRTSFVAPQFIGRTVTGYVYEINGDLACCHRGLVSTEPHWIPLRNLREPGKKLERKQITNEEDTADNQSP